MEKLKVFTAISSGFKSGIEQMENNAHNTVAEKIEKAVEKAKALAEEKEKIRKKAREAKEKAYEAYEEALNALEATPEYKAKEKAYEAYEKECRAYEAYEKECRAYEAAHRNYMRALENEDVVMETYYAERAYDDIYEFEYYCCDNLKRRRNNYGK